MNERTLANDDETLSAFLDGALPQAEERRLRARLAAEPELNRRLEALRRADAAVRDAYAPIVDEPLPESVVRVLGGNVIRLGRRSPVLFRLPVAIAAGIALAAGVLSTYVLLPRPGSVSALDLLASGGTVHRGTALYGVLETRTSAESTTVGRDLSAVPRLTFRNSAGEYCRQVDVAGQHGAAQAVACRGDGAWRLEVASFAAAEPRRGAGAYRPASAADDPVIVSAIDAMIAGAPLGREEERKLIANGWPASSSP